MTAVLTIGNACGGPSVSDFEPDDAAAVNGNGHVANGIKPLGDDSRRLCLQVNLLAERSNWIRLVCLRVATQDCYTSTAPVCKLTLTMTRTQIKTRPRA